MNFFNLKTPYEVSIRIAEKAKAKRKYMKLTQQQLADKIGKKREYISTIERGNSDMQMSTFLQIASALGLRFSLVVD